jgi:hypothetical protein
MQVEVNFEKAGNYHILVNGSKVGNVTVHEAGYSSENIGFSNMSLDFSQANYMGVGLSFLIKNNGPYPQNITYILDACDARIHCISSLPAFGEATFSMAPGTGPLNYQRDAPGVRTVKVWYKGNVVLAGNYTVPPLESLSDILQPDYYPVIMLILALVLFTTIFVKVFLSRTRNKVTLYKVEQEKWVTGGNSWKEKWQ